MKKAILMFSLGFAIGYYVKERCIFELLKEKINKQKKEQIEETKEETNDISKVSSDVEAKYKAETMEEYDKLVKEYMQESKEEVKETPPEKDIPTRVFKPTVIDPMWFGENPEYETIIYYYHSNGTVTDDLEEVVLAVQDHIGDEALASFGLFESDRVCVVNDDEEAYYEILLVDDEPRT